ncbi:hypothetical protein ACU4IU_00020 [Brevibacterium sp. CSND-B09]|uniref:hypothetical protein n=1 Tax=Brevibacterium sp. CSND-B09 TaxID=3462571 RepID=UPI00406A4914
MTKIEIDEATGLPELPDGEVWQVEEQRVDSLGARRGWYLSILGPEREREWSSWETDLYYSEPTLRREDSDTIQTREVLLGRTWYGARKVRHEYRYAIGTGSNVRWVSRIAYAGEYPTQKDLRTAAFRALKARARRAEATSLIGLYPPNTIGESND